MARAPSRPPPPARPDDGAPHPARWLTWRNTLGAGVVAFALWGMVAAGWLLLGGEGASSSAPIRSLAVLPLDNYTGDPEQEYFVDGMTEKLITELAQIGDLLVMSRSAVMRYRQDRPPVREIARELRVDAVIEGSVLRVEDEVRITAQLIDGATEAHLWANDYVRDFRDLISLQKDVARAIAGEIEVSLTPAEADRLAAERSIDPAAQEAFLRGVHLQRRFQDGGEGLGTIRRAIDFLREAIDREPAWAEAHAELARAYHWLASSGSGLVEYYGRSKAAALEAIRLDESLAAGHGALAFVLHNYDADWSVAEREYQRALELAPNDDYYRWGYGLFLLSAGRYGEAAASFRRALRHAPLSRVLQGQLARALTCDGRHGEARQVLEEIVRIQPDHWGAHARLGCIDVLEGATRQGIGRVERAVR